MRLLAILLSSLLTVSFLQDPGDHPEPPSDEDIVGCVNKTASSSSNASSIPYSISRSVSHKRGACSEDEHGEEQRDDDAKGCNLEARVTISNTSTIGGSNKKLTVEAKGHGSVTLLPHAPGKPRNSTVVRFNVEQDCGASTYHLQVNSHTSRGAKANKRWEWRCTACPEATIEH